ncbi:Galactosyltransferase [Handroanthus impetiginosus]|uniref:Galactosyltransferase n=1 Tax=Handroanthus impetiginosus TaxID=429701 RepID=A0A2G9HLF2_9LAMI|nr:Galactosyltransferase [Handroanthus impetiginosus]
MHTFSRAFTATPSRFKHFLLLLSALLFLSILHRLHHLHHHLYPSPAAFPTFESPTTLPPPLPSLSVHHLLFSVASSSSSLNSRASYLRIWHSPISHLNTTFLFLDRPLPNSSLSLPPIIVQAKSSSLSAGHRIARIVKDALSLNVPGIYWYVFGDDDTFFFTENLVRILSKYDHNKWYYIGCGSESYEQNEKFYFDMAFGGGGYAISAPLARVLGRVLDSCLDRYRHFYGSDARVFACLAELGVHLTIEPGFHQVDVRGNLFGLLSAHPLSLVASLHHIDAVEPIFPGMSRIQALEHLFNAVHVDPARVLQQSVCYDRTNSLTVSISWGYAIQVYEGNELLPEVLTFQRTFKPWKRGKNVASSRYMFKTRDYPSDPCKRPVVFFLHTEVADTAGIWTNYTRHSAGDCLRSKEIEKLKEIIVFSHNLGFDIEQMKAPRRDCCDILSSSDETMRIQIRKCGTDELITRQG